MGGQGEAVSATCWVNGEELTRAEIVARMGQYAIPEHCRDGLAGYLTKEYKHIGSFLTALLSNDLKETFARADDVNSAAIQSYICFLYNCAPSGSWGSPARVKDWLSSESAQ